MSASGLSAAALLMNVTSNERSKIAQKITSNEFSHELSQLQQSQPALPGMLPESRNTSQRSAEQAPGPASPGLVVVPQPPTLEPSDAKTEAGSEVPSSPCSQGKCGAAPTRAGQVKSKALSQQQAQETLYFTDVVALERVMAQLKLSAEARQTCQGTGDKQGRVPLKTVRSLLLTQSAGAGPNGAPLVAAKDVLELVSSLCQVQNGSARSLEPFKTKPAGFYSLGELNELLTRVVREVADKRLRNTPLAERKGTAVPVPDLKPEITDAEPAVIPRGQVERLMSQRIPTFSRASDKEWEESDDASSQGSEIRPEGFSVPAGPSVPASAAGLVPGQLKRAVGPTGEQAPIDAPDSAMPLAPPSGRPQSVETVPDAPLQADATERVHAGGGERPAGMTMRSEPKPFEADLKVVDHRFAPDQQEAAARIASRPDVSAYWGRTVHLEGQGQDAQAQIEHFGASDGHDARSSLEGRGTISLAKGSGMESGERGSDPRGALDSSLKEPRASVRVAEGAKPDSSGFETLGVEGERLAPVGKSSAASGQETGARLALAESSWPESLSKQIEESHRQGRSHLTIELEPENLGKLVLRIESDRHQVSAWVSTQSEDARSVLLQGASALRRHLEEQGLTLGQFSVDVGRQGEEQRFAQAGRSRKAAGRASRIDEGPSVSVSSLQRPSAYSGPDRLINVFA